VEDCNGSSDVKNNFHAMLLPAIAVPLVGEGRNCGASAASFIFEILNPELKR